MMKDIGERQLRGYARLAGFAYLLQNVLFFAWLIITSRMVVAADFAATARNIMASEHLYRIGLSIGVVSSAATIFLAWAFYVLLKPVDRNLALFALLCRVAEAIFYGAFFFLYFVGVEICKGTASGFDAAGRQGLWNLVSRGELAAGSVSGVYFYFGATTFFYLLFKARFIPRIISVFGMFTAFLSLTSTLGTMIVPALEAKLQLVGAPLAATEILAGAWLLFAGASLKFWNSRNESSPASAIKA
jgi:hypothetical protein